MALSDEQAAVCQVARCTKIINPNTDDAKYVINVKQIAKVVTYCTIELRRMLLMNARFETSGLFFRGYYVVSPDAPYYTI
eukprot:1177151-Prorocentrum_minimum.AAC.5